MKKIYTFSVEDDISQSMDLQNQVKVFCYLMYDELRNLEDEKNKEILLHDNVIYNELLENFYNNKYYYHFKYENSSGTYEPFMTNNITFGFTVDSDNITDSEIVFTLCKVKQMINFPCSLHMNGIAYTEDKHGKNRLVALKKIVLEEKNFAARKTKERLRIPSKIAV